EKPPEPRGPLPTAAEVRAAKKAELVAWSDKYELSTEGKVDELRKRLLAFLTKEEAKAAREAKKAAEPKEPEKEEKAEEKPAKEPELRKKPKKKEKEEESKNELVQNARAKHKH